jgi:excinuclease ABC subunit B
VIFYADTITMSMQKTIDETNRRREKQIAYNTAHGITPTTIRKTKEQVFAQGSVLEIRGYDPDNPNAIQPEEDIVKQVADEQPAYKTIPELEKLIERTKKEMERAARDLDFMEAARLRDEMFRLQKELQIMRS